MCTELGRTSCRLWSDAPFLSRRVGRAANRRGPGRELQVTDGGDGGKPAGGTRGMMGPQRHTACQRTCTHENAWTRTLHSQDAGSESVPVTDIVCSFRVAFGDPGMNPGCAAKVPARNAFRRKDGGRTAGFPESPTSGLHTTLDHRLTKRWTLKRTTKAASAALNCHRDHAALTSGSANLCS